jgi:hypothetical protein
MCYRTRRVSTYTSRNTPLPPAPEDPRVFQKLAKTVLLLLVVVVAVALIGRYFFPSA